MKTQWIFAAGMRRAGSTMQYHWAKDIVEYADGFAAGLIPWQGFEKLFSNFDGVYPFVLVKGHVFYPDKCPSAKRVFDEQRAKAVYIYRDIRDVAISTFDMGKYEWDYVANIEVPSILNEYKQWTNLPKEQIDILRYEGLPFPNVSGATVMRLARFLNINIGWRMCETIAKKHSIKAHQQIIDKMEKGFDRHSLLWHNHIKSGRVGRFRDGLTSEQRADIEAVAKDWLIAEGYM